jgi:HK97 family phage major capsid protein
MGYALALQEDNELINGTGAATTYFGVRGLLNRIGSAAVSTAATGHDTWPELDMADVVACISLVPERYDRNLSWICSRNFYYSVLWRLEMSGGGNTIATLSQGATGQPMFGGYPVYFTSRMPTATAAATVCALFGSWRDAVILGDRTGVSLARDDSFAFSSDLITLRATTRYDFNVHEPGDSSAVGAYVALKTAS